jgi:DNA-binding transcriptional LysR family regulator
MQDAEISLRHLRALSLLLELQSLTRVGDILGTNQSTVSKILAKLRKHFDDALFVRVGSSMHPTPRALEMAAPLRNMLAMADTICSPAAPFDSKSSTREFKVLVTEVGLTNLVPPLMRELERSGDRLRLRAVPLDSRNAFEKLEVGEADIALGVFPKEAGGLRRQRLFVEPYVSVVRIGHPRLARLTQLDAFLEERHIIVTASNVAHTAHRQIETVLMSRLDPSRIQLTVPSFVACMFVAKQTDGIGTIPEKLAGHLVRDLSLAAFVPPLVLPRIEVSQVWHERVDRDAGHRWLRAKIFDLFRQRRRSS